MIRAARASAALAFALLAAACASPPPDPLPDPNSAAHTTPSARAGEPLFSIHTQLPGLTYVNVSGGAQQLSVLEQNGQGLAILDFDGDGWMDLFVTNGGTLAGLQAGDVPGFRLYRNLTNWHFQDVTSRAGLSPGDGDQEFWGTGAAAADYDADGDTDLYVTGWGANRLFRNEGNGRFSDVTRFAGVGEERWSSSAVFADFDGDGRLDLYVSNYVAFDPSRVPETEADGSPCLYRGLETGCGPWRYRGERDTLYLQLPDGRFSDASLAWGLAATDGFRGMGIAPGDFDRDGDVDLYIGCDVMPNLYLENLSENHSENLSGRGFRSAGRERGLDVNAFGKHESGMGVVAVDLFDRGQLDLLTTNFAGETNTYYRSLGVGEGRFEDQSSRIGFDAHRAELGWGIVAGDFDGDGRRDIFVANGQIYPQVDELGESTDSYRQLPRVYFGQGGKGDREQGGGSSLREGVPEHVFRRSPGDGSCRADSCLAFSLRAAAAGDLDNDGDLDIVAIQHNGPLVVFENLSQQPAPWIQLESRGGGASPHGARIEILELAGKGEPVLGGSVGWGGSVGAWSHEHFPTSGYQSSHDPRVQLPRSPGAIARVTWSDGACEEFAVPSSGERVVWREGNGAKRCGAAVAD